MSDLKNNLHGKERREATQHPIHCTTHTPSVSMHCTTSTLSVVHSCAVLRQAETEAEAVRQKQKQKQRGRAKREQEPEPEQEPEVAAEPEAETETEPEPEPEPEPEVVAGPVSSQSERLYQAATARLTQANSCTRMLCSTCCKTVPE